MNGSGGVEGHLASKVYCAFPKIIDMCPDERLQTLRRQTHPIATITRTIDRARPALLVTLP